MTEFEKWLSKQSIEGKKRITSFNGVHMSDIQLLYIGFSEGQKHPEWTPVSIRPKYTRQKFVTVLFGNGVVHPALFHPEFVNTIFTYEGRTLDDIIAWQSLPEA